MAEHPREYMDHLLKALHEANLGWIAEEIAAEIGAGRMVEKEVETGRRRASKGLSIEDYGDDERLAIALRIVLERAQIGHAVWTELTELLQRRLGVQSVDFIDIKGEQGIQYDAFSVDFAAAVEELATAFNKVATECGLWGDDVRRLSERPRRLVWDGGEHP